MTASCQRITEALLHAILQTYHSSTVATTLQMRRQVPLPKIMFPSSISRTAPINPLIIVKFTTLLLLLQAVVGEAQRARPAVLEETSPFSGRWAALHN
jgi:hypothetical protein